jgi:hypothetical protein
LSRDFSLYVLHAGMIRVPNVRTDHYACTLFDECSCHLDAFLALIQKITQSAMW